MEGWEGAATLSCEGGGGDQVGGWAMAAARTGSMHMHVGAAFAWDTSPTSRPEHRREDGRPACREALRHCSPFVVAHGRECHAARAAAGQVEIRAAPRWDIIERLRIQPSAIFGLVPTPASSVSTLHAICSTPAQRTHRHRGQEIGVIQ